MSKPKTESSEVPLDKLWKYIFGRPLPTSFYQRTRLGFWLGLPILAVDALSSVAYATEEILIALSFGGSTLIPFAFPIALAIIFLLSMLIFSYSQIISVYPEGGGAYIISKHNLGETVSLVGAASLMIDYVLTVAVSVTAATRAVTSAYPHLLGITNILSLIAIIILMWINLRGIRQSAKFVSLPVYLFIGFIITLGIIGTFSVSSQELAPLSTGILDVAAILILLRAFAGGCTAMTGLEVIANAGNILRKPQLTVGRNILFALGLALGFSFYLITVSSLSLGLTPLSHESLLSQLGRAVWGEGYFHTLFQILTALMLWLAANTAFAGFPKLVAIVAQDKWLPKQLSSVGDRLVFSTAIVLLGLSACFLTFIFKGNLHALIPLYAIGVFIAFSLSQFGMVKYWLKELRKMRMQGGKKLSLSFKAMINCLGGILTLLTLCITFEAKFLQGGFLILLVVPLLVFFCYTVKRHYLVVEQELHLTLAYIKERKPHFSSSRERTVVVPVSRLHKGTLEALRFACELSADVKVLIVDYGQTNVAKIVQEVQDLGWGVQVIMLESPYRSIARPIIDYVQALDVENKHLSVLVLPEFVTVKWWQKFLHNHRAKLISDALEWNEHIPDQARIIINVPYYLGA